MTTLLDQRFPASTEVLSALRLAVRDACRDAHCSDECSEQLVLAINEACMNIIQHGYRFARDQFFTLRLFFEGDSVVVHLLDNGSPASDTDLRPRAFDELRPGGLGVHFMREVMDDVTYRPAPEGFTNCLQLSKRIY